MRVIAILALSVSTGVYASPPPTIHLEGQARFNAVGRCFITPFSLAALSRAPEEVFTLRSQRVRGTIQAVFEYDTNTAACSLRLFQPGPHPDGVFWGLCSRYPIPGSPTQLMPLQVPRTHLELLPVILADAFGFGAMNGYIVFPPDALPGDTPTPALGFSAHFVYTTTYVPPEPAAWPARWRLADGNPARKRCVYRGTFRLGRVPIF